MGNSWKIMEVFSKSASPYSPACGVILYIPLEGWDKKFLNVPRSFRGTNLSWKTLHCLIGSKFWIMHWSATVVSGCYGNHLSALKRKSDASCIYFSRQKEAGSTYSHVSCMSQGVCAEMQLKGSHESPHGTQTFSVYRVL